MIDVFVVILLRRFPTYSGSKVFLIGLFLSSVQGVVGGSLIRGGYEFCLYRSGLGE